MKIIATLACRNNSSRLYGKPLQYLESFSVVEYIIKNLRQWPQINEIVLAISEKRGNEIFIEIAEKNGLRYVLGDDENVLLRLIQACEMAGGDTIYRVTTESPFGYLEGICEAILSHYALNADYTSHGNLPDGVLFELITLEALKNSYKNGEVRHKSELVPLYIFEHPEKFKINILEIPVELQRPQYRLTIDFPEDLILCRAVIKNFGEDNYISYMQLIKFLDSHPELHNIVKGITAKDYLKPFH